MSAHLAVVNGRLVLPGGVEQAELVICDGRIVAVGGLPKKWSGPRIDAGQMLVAAGFIDLQLNGAFGVDFTEDGAGIWKAAARLPEQGVTSFLPTVVSSPPDSVHSARRALASPPAGGGAVAEPLGLHLEGPLLNPDRRGAHSAEHLREPSAHLVADWCPENGVVMVTIAPELPGALEVISLLARRGVTVAAGHSEATAEEAVEAVRAGVSHVTHLYNAMSPLHHRKPGLVGFTLARRDVTAGIIVDGVHSDPTAVAVAWNAKGSDGLVLITDACALQGMQDGPPDSDDAAPTTRSSSAGSTRSRSERPSLGSSMLTRRGNAVHNEQGALAGSVLTMPEAVRNLVEYTGCEISEAVAAATATPARVVGAGSKGVLAAGRDADIVLLDDDLRVALTVVGGRIAYDPGALAPERP
ncbi:MAG: N-acetylglucosamine-6-phosphate deacetylase [Acidimicrobiaceae bacterium]|nr:N-acetylglucosamine-6-phosphate deacetylase [Acidimicrobiaceae bacterium]